MDKIINMLELDTGISQKTISKVLKALPITIQKCLFDIVDDNKIIPDDFLSELNLDGFGTFQAKVHKGHLVNHKKGSQKIDDYLCINFKFDKNLIKELRENYKIVPKMIEKK